MPLIYFISNSLLYSTFLNILVSWQRNANLNYFKKQGVERFKNLKQWLISNDIETLPSSKIYLMILIFP